MGRRHVVRSVWETIWLRRTLITLCSVFPLVVAAANTAPDATATAAVTAPSRDDPVTAALLRTMEEQIAGNRLVSPPSDNAVETWRRVLQLQSEHPDSLEIRHALRNFEDHARIRAAKEKAAGRMPVATALVMFADQVSRLTGDANPPSSEASTQDARNSDQVPISPPTPGKTADSVSAPPEIRSSEAAAPSAIPAAATEAKEDQVNHADTPASPATTVPPQNRPDDTTPVPTPANPPSATERVAPAHVRAATAQSDAPTAADDASAAYYISRGDEMLARKDVSAARKFYEYAANAGNARAATALAKTFDAAFIARLGVIGLKTDMTQAAFWFRRAAASGDRDAGLWLAAHQTEAAK